MRGKSIYCMAVRNINTKEIAVEKNPVKSLANRAKLLKLPFIRGIASFVDSLVLGMKIIMRSATLSGLDEETQEQKKSKLDIWLENKFGEKLTDYIIYFSVFISIILSIGIFMVLPVWISSFITKFFNVSLWGIGVVEGLVRILIFLAYILLMSKMKENIQDFIKDVEQVF